MAILPSSVLGYTISNATGCFERTTDVIRSTEPTCTFTILPDTASENVNITTENIDPDTVTVAFSSNALTVDYGDVITISGALTQATTITIEPWYELSDELWFIAISDNQARGTVEANPVFEDMLPMMNRINPPFITNSGDLVQGSDDTETLEDMFAAVLESLTESVVPIYVIAGNHDYDPGLATYSSYFGPVDYSYDIGPARIITLSTAGDESRGTVSDEQLEWLEEELTATDRQTLLIAHHPVSVPSWGRTTCCYVDTTERDALVNVLDAQQIGIVVAGHSQGYDYRYLTSDDVSTIETGFYQLVTGGAGGNISQPGGDYHFTLVQVTPTAITPIPFNLDDTSLAFDETNNNGKRNQAMITSEYAGEHDLPYLRLKFDLKDRDASYLVSDADGNYLPYQSHDYGSHRILLATASQAKNTTTNFTAAVVTTLHRGTTNTVNTDSYIQLADLPTKVAKDTHITVTPSKLSTTITNLKRTRHGYRWIETPTRRSVDTTYTVQELTDGDVVRVYLNGRLRKRLVVEDGQVEFTFAKNARQRQIRIKQ